MTKEKSYMTVVPEDENDRKDLDGILNRLSSSSSFKLISHKMKHNTVTAKIQYLGEEYLVDFYPTDIELPDLYRRQHIFPDVDIQELEIAESGIAVEMQFGKKPLQSYHLQLKIMDAILPRKLAVYDDSSEKILSGKWVAMAAQSSVPPAPRYIYTVQAVYDESCVWLHSHGLNRCGITELEILHSSKETYSSHYTILETMASRLLEAAEPFKAKEPMYLARFSEDVFLVTTMVPWKEAIKRYEKDMLGGIEDRREGHNGNTSAVFVYPSQDALDHGKYEPVFIYDDILENNPIYMFTTSETNRMRALAAERIHFVKEAIRNPENKILIKVGLEVDQEYKEEGNSYEHIWFELKKFCNDTEFTAKLTQEPYYIKSLHEGSIGKYKIDEVTDWMIFTPERKITPDDVYLIAE